MTDKTIVPFDQIERSIMVIRGRRVMLDSDLAELYGATTKALNQAVSRNRDRFPSDFMFRLTKEEKQEVVTNCDHLRKLKFSPNLPRGFTEHGAIMLASVLNSHRAVEISVYVVRAFSHLSRILRAHQEIIYKVDELERRVQGHDQQLQALISAIRQLMEPPKPKKKQIGFHWDEKPAATKKKTPVKKKGLAQKKKPAKLAKV